MSLVESTEIIDSVFVLIIVVHLSLSVIVGLGVVINSVGELLF